MKNNDIYIKLAQHLNSLGMGYPPSEYLEIILRDNFTPLEAEVALAIPTKVIPLQPLSVDKIAQTASLSREKANNILEALAEKGMLYSGQTEEGQRGYALQHVGFGFPQSFFWRNEDTEHSRDMSYKVGRYFNTATTREAYGKTETKPFQFIPVGESISVELQSVYPYQMMDQIIKKTKIIAVAHCACRVRSNLSGRVCDHPTEVCMKFDDLAEHLIERELAKEISQEQALDIIRLCQEYGLVHFVDNARGDIKHNCNCCGCSCWSMARIRSRKIPRDVIMATYFIRQTDEEMCSGCGDCVKVCPVEAIAMEDDIARVEEEWCIGCGICINKCPTLAAQIIVRPDKKNEKPAVNFQKLHETILEEKGLK